jgi:hypothetical protein
VGDDPGFLSSIVRALRARVLLSSATDAAGSDQQPYATMQDEESIHVVGGSNDLAMSVSCGLAFGAGPDVGHAMCVLANDEDQVVYVVGGSQGYLSVFDAARCHRTACMHIAFLGNGIRALVPVPKVGVVVAGLGGPMCVVDINTAAVKFVFSVAHVVGTCRPVALVAGVDVCIVQLRATACTLCPSCSHPELLPPSSPFPLPPSPPFVVPACATAPRHHSSGVVCIGGRAGVWGRRRESASVGPSDREAPARGRGAGWGPCLPDAQPPMDD